MHQCLENSILQTMMHLSGDLEARNTSEVTRLVRGPFPLLDEGAPASPGAPITQVLLARKAVIHVVEESLAYHILFEWVADKVSVIL